MMFWSKMMLVAMVLPIFVACGDDNDDGGATAYTESEIVELLTGKWEVYGEFKVTNDNNESVSDNYKGTIEFKADKSVKFKVTEGTKYKDFEEKILNNSKYSVLKKGGRNYISFDSSLDPYNYFIVSYNFEIVSLKKNTFMLKLDRDVDDSDNISKLLGHVYMTIVSN